MSNAVENQVKIQNIRQRMFNGEITYHQAKELAQPIIDDINTTATRLAKKYKLPARKIDVVSMMR